MINLKLVLSFLIAACVAITLACFCFDIGELKVGVQRMGLLILWVLLIAWCFWGARVFLVDNQLAWWSQVRQWWCGNGRWDLFFVCVVSVCVHLQEPHEYKVLMDEINLLNISRAIYETQQVYSPVGFDFVYDDYVLSREGYIGKRPYFFPFMVSILHFLTGYRYTNGFLLNILMTPVLFGLMLALVRAYLARPLIGYAAILLFVSFPVVAQVATSSGAEWLNATLVLLLGWTAILFNKRPSLERMQFMFATACVLAYARYESVVYVLAAVGIWGMVCWRERRILLAYGTCLYPFVLIPLIWIMRIVQADESAYFQHETLNTNMTFSMSYVGQNVDDFRRFMLEMQPISLNAPVTTVLLLLLLVTGVCRMLGTGGSNSSRVAWLPVSWSPLLWLGLVASACQVLLLFYVWGNLNDPLVTRIALPFLMLWVLVAVTLWGAGFSERVKATPVCCILLICLWFGLFSKGEALAARMNLPVIQATLAGKWVREELGPHDVVFTWNTHLFLPYQVKAFPEYNLHDAFEQVSEMLTQGLFNRVFLYYDPARSKPLYGDHSRYWSFLEKGGNINLVHRQIIGPGHEMQFYELDFSAYQLGFTE